jgi:hypothetical protein
MNFGRTPEILHHFSEDIFHLAPVPVIYHQVKDNNLDKWHAQLIQEARDAFEESVLEVPDVRHINDMGSPPNHGENPGYRQLNSTFLSSWRLVQPG